jgi:hypothetical protein
MNIANELQEEGSSRKELINVAVAVAQVNSILQTYLFQKESLRRL